VELVIIITSVKETHVRNYVVVLASTEGIPTADCGIDITRRSRCNGHVYHRDIPSAVFFSCTFAIRCELRNSSNKTAFTWLELYLISRKWPNITADN
jgi:hypothetical protein